MYVLLYPLVSFNQKQLSSSPYPHDTDLLRQQANVESLIFWICLFPHSIIFLLLSPWITVIQHSIAMLERPGVGTLVDSASWVQLSSHLSQEAGHMRNHPASEFSSPACHSPQPFESFSDIWVISAEAPDITEQSRAFWLCPLVNSQLTESENNKMFYASKFGGDMLCSIS